jgi:flagellar biosynthesis protein FliP
VTKRNLRRWMIVALLVGLVLLLAGCTVSSKSDASGLNLQVTPPTGDKGEMANTLQIMMLLSGLALVPVILMLTTGFIRIVIVLSVVRSAIGVQQMPPNQVIISLALILTFFVMSPVMTQINDQALQPMVRGDITQSEAISRGIVPLRQFMFKQVRQEDVALFLGMAKLPRPANQDEVPTQVLIPAYVISELRTAFQMAFVIYIPFLVIDMVVGTALLSMGMMMLPPTVVSLPFKLLLFVLVDGWRLIAQSLVLSFH